MDKGCERQSRLTWRHRQGRLKWLLVARNIQSIMKKFAVRSEYHWTIGKEDLLDCTGAPKRARHGRYLEMAEQLELFMPGQVRALSDRMWRKEVDVGTPFRSRVAISRMLMGREHQC